VTPNFEDTAVVLQEEEEEEEAGISGLHTGGILTAQILTS